MRRARSLRDKAWALAWSLAWVCGACVLVTLVAVGLREVMGLFFDAAHRTLTAQLTSLPR